MYYKDNKFWKQFTTGRFTELKKEGLWCITKIINSESNSQLETKLIGIPASCDVSQR